MSDNYYNLLELDPSVDDWTVIEAAMKAHQRSWAVMKNQGSPVARRNAGRWLAFLPDMEVVLRDPTRRKAIADAARMENADKKRNALSRLDELIAVIVDAAIGPDEVKLLARQVGDGITEAEVVARLKERGKSVESRKAAPAARPKLDRAIAAEIRDNLRHIRKASLYDFLGHSPRSSPQMLQDAADEIYKELRRKGLTDADSTARQALAGHCKAVFRSAAEKEQYDNSYAAEAMESLTAHLEVAGRDAFLDQAELDVLLREARVKGVHPDVALEFIAVYAQNRKWSIQKSKGLASSRLKLCGFCNSIARTAEDVRCHQCGQELIQPCPRCSVPTPTQDECCGACGASTGDAPVVHGLMREAREHLARNEFARAVTCLDRALLYWDKWPPILELRRNVDAARLAFEDAIAGVETSVRANRLSEARALIDRLKRELGGVETKDLERRI
ncbi:MAG TPA: hypothetical protein VFO89_17215, partial [Thermoanaerobaculia bacterium]|nr:hypothetical protein [Thermoanaerobaculia bacterium]